MSRIEERLGEMGVMLPDLPTPIANYVPAKRAGNLVFIAGQVSAVEGRAYKGKLGAILVQHQVEKGRVRNWSEPQNLLLARPLLCGEGFSEYSFLVGALT